MREPRKRITRKTAVRANVVAMALASVALIIILKLAYLQLYKYDYYHKLVMKEITIETTVNPERGTIYDTNGNVLASNATVYTCFLSPQDIIDDVKNTEKAKKKAEKKAAEAKKKGEKVKKASAEKEVDPTVWTSESGKTYTNLKKNQLIARFLSELLDLKYGDLIKTEAKKGRRYEEIAWEISEEKAEKIREFVETYKLDREIYLIADSKRYYPGGDLACHLLGFTNSDGVGVYGLESYYNNVLEGTGGRYVTAQDARSNEMDFKYETYIDPENGYNITTTLDTYIQYQLENELEATLTENAAANRVCGIVMDVNTGGILGMAVAPSFDCNEPYELDTLSLQKLEAFAGSEEEQEEAMKVAEKQYIKKNPKADKNADGFKQAVENYYNANKANINSAAKEDYEMSLVFEMWKNKAITELYEPGSTSKIITTAMAFQDKVVKPEDSFTCTGSLKIEGYGKPIHCHERNGHGTMTYARGLQQSCNPTLMQAAFNIGRERFYNYFLDFGYGDITGIDLPNEAKTYYHSYEDFSNVSLAVYSFGQTYKTTAIQQLCAISAVANGGKVVTPHLLKELTDKDGNIIKSFETNVKRQVVSEEVCKTIAGILQEGVATDGGAKNAYVKGYKVAAKTGTSEKIDAKDPSGETYLRVGSCVAFAPADDPEIAVIIVCDEPSGGSVYGSVVAAPYVSDFLSNVLPYLGYEPNYTEAELNDIEVSIRDYTGFDVSGAKSDITNKGIRAQVVGNGSTVTGQVPEAGSSVCKDGGKIILYTGGSTPKDTVEVPDLIGKNAEQANATLTNAGLNVSISGTTSNSEATVAVQSIAAGTKVPEGTVVEISVRVLTNAADD